MTHKLKTREGMQLLVQTRQQDGQVEVLLETAATHPLVLHWGLRKAQERAWVAPPDSCWPPGTVATGKGALQTPFVQDNGRATLRLRLSASIAEAALNFVLFFPEKGRWDDNNGRNYEVPLTESPTAKANPLDSLRALAGTEEVVFERVFDLAGGSQLAAGVSKAAGDAYRFRCVCNHQAPLLLHWGVARRSPHEWLLPPDSWPGVATAVLENKAAQTPFIRRHGLNTLAFDFPEADAPLGIQFVLREVDGRWINYRGGNFYVPVQVRSPGAAAAGAGQHAVVAEEIVRAETTHNSWTLMHRFNLCCELLDRVHGSVDGQALLYVYLRFSAIRQLTWQRNYNTKPRELAHAQERLTGKLAETYRTQPASRPLLRLALATVGRGAEGQRIRDEILNIMHRHHIKEVSGHFLEEWHQKLHNNTTPDDIVICQAYLAFLQSNGNRDSFYQALEAGGVTRQRLESFERPIRSHPDFVPHLKDALLHDFHNFLKILKASHSGTDLETAINAARGHLDEGVQGVLNHIWTHRHAGPEQLLDLVRHITDARRRLSPLFGSGRGLRELLYLDLGLEQLLRAAVEGNIHLRPNGDNLVDLIAWVLENVTLSYEEPELALCSRHWERLKSLPRFDAAWSVHAKSVVDRVSRALSAWIDRFYQLLQPKAEFLGRGFGAEPWTISLFSEEVVRGSSLGFVLSMLLRHLDPMLRHAAHIGNWQIISRGRGIGRLEVVAELRSVQGRSFENPAVIVADRVTGDEEIPEGVTAVIAPDVVDIVSHVAVRARNANVLFASCHEPELLQHLKSLQGRHLCLEVNPAGDVISAEAAPEAVVSKPQTTGRTPSPPRAFTRYAIPSSEFDESLVGGKSCHLARLHGVVPEWIRLPASAALPFGVFEHVMEHGANREVAKRYAGLVAKTAQAGTEMLGALRETVLSLSAPEELKSALHEAMSQAGLAWPQNWELAWKRIKQIWASKWNERAFLSRQRVGLPHETLTMAVLVQEVVPADYAYVIHTVNPSSGNSNELFAEMVLGLGEALVGNYPGRALSFRFDKTTGGNSVLSFPSKSVGLYGEGLIFRSDSSGEDLAGYAGAGLYDSVLLKAPRTVDLDYTHEPLIWDELFRNGVLTAVARIGLELEQRAGTPQDIEGVVSGGEYFVVQTRPQVGLE